MTTQDRLSPDGKWWWDGSQWVPAISPDGRYHWDGRNWQALTIAPGEMARILACRRAGCANRGEFPCAYVDDDGNRCETIWCANHSHEHGGSRYCLRHDEVVRTLEAVEGSIRDFKRPAVNDRCLALAELMFDDIRDKVAEALRQRYEGTPGAEVVIDTHARPAFVGIDLHWERYWAVLTHTGYLTRVALRVPSHEPPQVKILIQKKEIFSETPDWVLHRLQGLPPDPQDRPRFSEKLVSAIKAGLDRPLTFV